MRTALIALAMLLSAAAEAAAQPSAVGDDSDTALFHFQSAYLPHYRPLESEPLALTHGYRAAALEPMGRSLSLGPFRVEMAGTARTDVRLNATRQVQFARFQLEDTHILGGDVSGAFDGRSGMLRLSWPTGR